MASLDLEGAVISPQVHRCGDTGNSTLKDLRLYQPNENCGMRSRSLTISAASVPAIENSRSAYFFQYPKSKGNLARNRSYASLVVAIACGLEFLFNPPSKVSAARTSFSQFSKLSVSSSWCTVVSNQSNSALSSHERRIDNLQLQR